MIVFCFSTPLASHHCGLLKNESSKGVFAPHDSLYESFLFQIDTVSMFTYSVSRLTALALSSGAKSWSHLHKGNTVCNTSAGAVLADSGQVVDQYYNSRDISPAGNRGYHVVRPLQHAKWSKGNDDFLVTDIWGVEAGSSVSKCPTVWLRQTEEKMYLVPYQHRGLTVILLIPVSSVVNGEQGIALVKQRIVETVSYSMILIFDI